MTDLSSRPPGPVDFITELNAFYESCGRPPYRKLADISEHLPELYGRRGLPVLSATAVFEVLAGRRKRAPSAAWVASFILCCQRRAWETGVLETDPGISALPHWQALLRAAQAPPPRPPAEPGPAGSAGPADEGGAAPHVPAPAGERPAAGGERGHGANGPLGRERGKGQVGEPGTRAEAGAGRTRAARAGVGRVPAQQAGGSRDDSAGAHAVRLTASQRAAIADYGEHGNELLRAVRDGDADALFRVAVLLGTDATRGSEAVALLIEAAADGHPPALDLLDAEPDGPDPREAARLALGLGEAAAARGAFPTALAYFKAAVRGGLLDAAYKITEILGRGGPAGRVRPGARR